MKLLTMCSTRNRPEWMKRMIYSFFATRRADSELAIYISTDDPKLEEYKNVVQNFETQREELNKVKTFIPNLNIETYLDRLHFHIGDHKWMTEVLNYFSTVIYPNIDYYHEVNDDHIFVTEGWDIKMIQVIENNGGWGICCPNDGIDLTWSLKNPSSYIISGNIVRALGYFVLPTLRHMRSDQYTHTIGMRLGMLFWAGEDVIIEHRCWHTPTAGGIGSRAIRDGNVDFTYSKDEEMYAENIWNNLDISNDCNKIITAKMKAYGNL